MSTLYDAVLASCDLVKARDEIIGFHKIVNAEAEARGESALFKQEYATAWAAFRDNPTIDSARTLLEVSPPLLQYFQLCSR